MIFNKSRKTILSAQEHYCRTVFSQARGLMFRKKQNLIMEFPTERRISMHMLFVFYPIDVLLLNEKKEIVEIKRQFQPFSFWRSKEKGKYVVEMAFPGTYQESETLELDKYVNRIIAIEKRHIQKYGQRKMTVQELDKITGVS